MSDESQSEILFKRVSRTFDSYSLSNSVLAQGRMCSSYGLFSAVSDVDLQCFQASYGPHSNFTRRGRIRTQTYSLHHIIHLLSFVNYPSPKLCLRYTRSDLGEVVHCSRSPVQSLVVGSRSGCMGADIYAMWCDYRRNRWKG